ncbi:MAG: molybdopterin-dependent oxidoreductase, partial [Myxococcota bacterium]|nr:molybdopterin-dependent oxidoreductase [Myxococcota bacterium]
RFFIKAGGAVALTTVLPGCSGSSSDALDADASGVPDVGVGSDVVDSGPAVDAGGDAVVVMDTPVRPGETSAGPDVGPDVHDSAPEISEPPPCEEWAPDPLGEGSDAQPFESGAPPGGWGDEVPPISDNGSFYVTNYFGVANVDPCTWRLNISVRGESVASLALDEVYALEPQEREHTLQCIESGPKLMKMNNAIWTGRPMKDLLDQLGVTLDETLTGIRLLCADGYEVGLPMEELDVPIWLVWLMNGQRLPPEHGFPVRFLCPDRYGWQNAKQVVGIDFIEGDPVPGYQKVWDTHYRLQGLIAHPETLSLTASGESVRLLGKAYAGSDPVEWVGVSVDGGATFEDAEITYAPGPDRWTLWRFLWTPPAPGDYPVRCKARTVSGVETTDASDFTFPYDGGMTILLEVT